MDREAWERSLIRRLVDHIENQTTDMADSLMEVAAANYTSEEHFVREIEVLFRGSPHVLCLSGSLPRPGSYHTVDICGTPILVTRGADGRIRAMLNTCRHRGVRVVDGDGHARRFTCPFHAWVYDLEGNLVGIPVASAFDGICPEEKGLVELPVAEGHGLVLGGLQPGPPIDIDDYLGPGLADELAMLEFAGWEPYNEPHVHKVGANWKVTLDTFRENYHFNYLHRNTLGGYAYGGALTFDSFGPHLRNSSAIQTIDQIRGKPESEWGDVSPHFSPQYSLFPATCLSFDCRHATLWQIQPIDAATSQVIHTDYLRPGLPEEEAAKLADMAPWICKNVNDDEDFWVAGRTEPGIRTGLLETVIFGRNEPAPQHLHSCFAKALGAAGHGQS